MVIIEYSMTREIKIKSFIRKFSKLYIFFKINFIVIRKMENGFSILKFIPSFIKKFFDKSYFIMFATFDLNCFVLVHFTF